ncbi:hypothetical protein C9I50_12410 [Pseudomonas prosekii]|nr:hypothetical protein C9I50_12410 [Pseudomonas prosekii]
MPAKAVCPATWMSADTPPSRASLAPTRDWRYPRHHKNNSGTSRCITRLQAFGRHSTPVLSPVISG